ncbi:hypothetical protein [Plebeiibacterium marinum]|uniref:Transglutaminase-like domain-containing protein n=1 Tax=Plebeiibacterium marinum TaxID=2992111 RepID=A0AAE3SK25_9BACT|nr:hypothetical protein [Plebeiobacterium marinum]MCW3806182.1 hypothetical protein [Plebeiobacterium marinum]
MFVSIMEASTKKILGTLAVVAAVGGGFYLIKKGKKLLSGAKMNFALLGFRIHKMDFQEVQFAVKLRCYNPTKAPITLAVNQVVAKYKGSAIAYSTPDIKGLTIGAGSTQEPEILFQVPYLNLLGKGLSLALLQNTSQFKADLSFTLSLSINDETITTTQNLTDDNMNGLALGTLGIVSGPRNTQYGRKYNHLIKRASGKDVFVKNGNVIETVESCIDLIAEHYREVEGLAQMLQTNNLKDTCRNIFNFSYNYLQYHKDKDGTEQLRTPARSWLDGQINFKQKGRQSAGIDCDDYSIFVGSILKCLGIPFKLRITKYDGRQNFQHIYVIVPAVGDSEDEIIIDPVLSKFDYQKPYSFEKSDFNMSPLQMVGGIHGIDGVTGTTSLGLPIYALSGLDLAGGTVAHKDDTELMAIISGIDFEDAVNGLGNADDATYRYLVRTRDFLLKNKENKNKMAQIQNPDQFISMIDQAIKFWNTPKRDKVLEKLADIEDKLTANGLIKYDTDAIEGLSEQDDYDAEIDGLQGQRGLGGFFKSLKRIGKKIGKGIKKGVKVAAKVTKKVVKAIVRFNPLSIAIRNGLLAALRLNMFGIAKKLQYAYLPDKLASKYSIDAKKLKDLKKRHNKVRKLFNGLQGKEKNLRKAILKGAKQKSKDFSLKGVDGLLSDLKGLESIGELAELGQLGVAATAASVGAATGVLAKIKSWLKPVANIFNKIRGKAAVKKVAKLTSQGKEVSKALQQRASQYEQQASPQQETYIQPENTLPQTTSYQPVILKSGNNVAQTTSSSVPQNISPTKKGMSKGAKVGIGIGVAALIGTGAYFMFRKKDDKPNSKDTSQKKSKKQSLGSISLQ